MEIITNLVHNEDRHTVVEFLKKEVKPFIIHLLDPKLITGHINNKSTTQSIESLISRQWSTMLTIKGQITGQFTPIELVDDAWVHVHLMVSGNKDRMVMLLSGQHNDLNYIDIGFVGDEKVFDRLMSKMGVTHMEAHMNATHYTPEGE